MVAASAPVLFVPLAAKVPAKAPPVPVHAVALVEVQVNVDTPPVATVVGDALKAAVGTPLTVTCVEATLLVPLAPEQVKENVVAAVSAAEVWVPLLASAPLQPPDAVHAVALVDVQVSVTVAPVSTAGCEAVIDAVGAAVGGGTAVIGVGLVEPPQAAKERAAMNAAAEAKNRIASPEFYQSYVIESTCAVKSLSKLDYVKTELTVAHRLSYTGRVISRDEERDLLPWIMGGVVTVIAGIAISLTALHPSPSAHHWSSPRAALDQPLQRPSASIQQIEAASPRAQANPATDATPDYAASTEAASATQAAATASPPLASTSASPPADPPDRVWECTTNGQKTFSDRPCGAGSVVREINPINRMDPTPATSTPVYFYPGQPDNSPPANYPSDDQTADSAAWVYGSTPIIGRARRNPSHETHHHGHSPSHNH